MSYEPLLLAPIEDGGLVTYYKPWLIGKKAFPVLEDAYLYRGSVKKREGYSVLGTVPTAPIQGFANYIVPATGDQQLIAFSTTKAYLFNNTTQVFDNISFFQTSGAAISWTGTADDYFWSSNYARSTWTTNFVDPIRFWNGSTTQGWNNQLPVTNGSNLLLTSLIIIPYKGRLIALNTLEGTIGNGINYYQRARYSQRGTPYVTANGADPVVVPPTGFSTDATAWRDDQLGKGGFIDADTTEKIVSCAIENDVLIVFFQRSTWRLTYTGNEILPFIWERINTQYGSESTFSTIPFDQEALTFSRFGYISSTTNSVKRIDEKIPDQTFFQTEFGNTAKKLQRIQGIRDFYRQTAYWAYPQANTNSSTNNRVLAYNYIDGSFAIYNQAFRCFGYYQTFNDLRWQDASWSWEDDNDQWNGVSAQNEFPQIVAANVSNGQVYTVYDIESDAQDVDSYSISDISIAATAIVTTSVINEFETGDQVTFYAVTGTMAGSINGVTFTATVIDDTHFSIPLNTVGLTYTGGGTATGLVNFGFNITTKQFNPYLEEGRRCRIQYVDIYCTRTNGGEITLDLFMDDNNNTPSLTRIVNIDTSDNSKYVRIFLGCIGRIFQIKLSLSEAQIDDKEKGRALFELQGIVLWTRREGRLKQ